MTKPNKDKRTATDSGPTAAAAAMVNNSNNITRSTVQLFVVVLALSAGFNMYVNWSKSSSSTATTATTTTESGGDFASDAHERVQHLEKELKTANQLLAEIKKDQVELDKMFSISRLVERAQKAKPQIRFASNDTRAQQFVTIAKATVKTTFHSCQKNIPVGQYDEYKNCFRDLSIELHNRIENQLPGSHYYVMAGRLNYAFMVTTMHSKRAEYFISLGDILFEILEYDDLVTNTPDPVPDNVPIEDGEEKVVINLESEQDKAKDKQ